MVVFTGGKNKLGWLYCELKIETKRYTKYKICDRLIELVVEYEQMAELQRGFMGIKEALG